MPMKKKQLRITQAAYFMDQSRIHAKETFSSEVSKFPVECNFGFRIFKVILSVKYVDLVIILGRQSMNFKRQ